MYEHKNSYLNQVPKVVQNELISKSKVISLVTDQIAKDANFRLAGTLILISAAVYINIQIHVYDMLKYIMMKRMEAKTRLPVSFL